MQNERSALFFREDPVELAALMHLAGSLPGGGHC